MSQNETLALLSRSYLDLVGTLELEQFRAFYGMRGMISNFMKDHPGTTYTRRQLESGLESGSFRADVIGDMRAYLAKHRDGFKGLLPVLAKTEEVETK